MSYAEIKPQYYQMHMPDSPWHAGSEGWKSAPWPSFGVNPNLVGPPRLAVEGLGSLRAVGAYYKPEYEAPISGFGDDATGTSNAATYIILGMLALVGGVLYLGATAPDGPLRGKRGTAGAPGALFTTKEIAEIKRQSDANAAEYTRQYRAKHGK